MNGSKIRRRNENDSISLTYSHFSSQNRENKNFDMNFTRISESKQKEKNFLMEKIVNRIQRTTKLNLNFELKSHTHTHTHYEFVWSGWLDNFDGNKHITQTTNPENNLTIQQQPKMNNPYIN